MTTHYICTEGCNGVSETPGVCGAPGCAGEGHELKACTCQDGTHAEVMGVEKEGSSDEG